MNEDIFPKTQFVRAIGKGTHWIRSRSNVRLVVFFVMHQGLTHSSDAANDADCAVRMYRRICGIAEKAGRKLVLSKYAADLKKDYESGRLGMNKTAATVSPKDENRPHFVIAEPSPQELKAYTLWHKQGLSLTEMCVALRSKDNPLKESTVM